jgi:hypothetical protein
MSESEAALKALGAFPIVQAAAAVLIVLTGLFLIRRGERDRREAPAPEAYPHWLLTGPAHDMMRSIQQQSEQSRAELHILERIEDLLKEIAREEREQTQMLELIRNESRLR